MNASQPRTVDEVDAALSAASPSEVERGAAAFDEARRELRSVVGRLDRTLGELDEAYRGAAAVGHRLAEPLRRTREVLHLLDEGEFGRQLRIIANGLAAGQARVRDLKGQRIAGATDVPFDQHAQQILRDVADGYRDVGVAVGGQSPPAEVSVDEPALGRALRDAARDGTATVELASDVDPAQLFRPAVPTIGALATDPALPPAGGAAGGGAGSGMMPFMPPMGGAMGGGMGGMGGMGGDGGLGAGQRKNNLQGDPSAWGKGEDDGWSVIGRKERVEAARQDFKDDFDEQIRKVTRGDFRDGR